jgi:hypothetical protein
VPSTDIKDEVEAVTAFLCDRDPTNFRSISEKTMEIREPREAVLLASVVRDSFFLSEDEHTGRLSEYRCDLRRELASKWALDLQSEYPALFRGSKVVRFFPHWVPIVGYSGKGADYRTSKRMEEMHGSLKGEVEKMGKELSDVLFVPYFGYGGEAGYQFSESMYHYIAGLVFKDMGYLVLDEYPPSLVTGTSRTPDLSVFRSAELAEALSLLGSRGAISSAGAFGQELQLYSIFGRQDRSQALGPSGTTIDAENIAVEVKRSESQYLVGVGSMQLRQYMAEAYGFYDEGFVAGPFLEGPGVVSLNRKGGLVLERGPPSASVAVTDFWAERRRLQMEDVRATMKLQLLKNLHLSEAIEVCGGKDSVRTYEELLQMSCELGIQDTIGALDRHRPMA